MKKTEINLSYKLIIQLGSLALIVTAGPIIVFLLFVKQGNL